MVEKWIFWGRIGKKGFMGKEKVKKMDFGERKWVFFGKVKRRNGFYGK